jgi:hypothetical protein
VTRCPTPHAATVTVAPPCKRFSAEVREPPVNRITQPMAGDTDRSTAATTERPTANLRASTPSALQRVAGLRDCWALLAWTLHLPPSAVPLVSDVRFRRSAQRLASLT